MGLSARRAVLAFVAGLLALAAASPVAAQAASANTTPILPSQDPFYTYSGSLTGVAPGAVLKTRIISPVDLGIATLPVSAEQILYRTTGELGQPTVTVATVIKPLVQVLKTKLVSYQLAYDGLGSECDPSYTLQGGNSGYNSQEEAIIGGYALAGDTVVVSDYEGTNLEWAAGQESGYGTLDAIRAAETLLGLSAATTPVGLVGYSGGSIATEFATELAHAYARHLDIVGAAEGGVPVDFAHNLLYVNGSADWSGVIPAVLLGVGRGFDLDIDQYLSSYGLEVAGQVGDECINSFFGGYPGLTYQSLLAPQYQNFLAIPTIARVLNHLIMSRTGTPREPLFMGVGDADGTGDGVMIAGDVEALAHTYCRRGASVQFSEYQGDDHTAAAIPFELGAFTFLAERLAGIHVKDGCGQIGPGNSLAPLPVTP